MAYANSSGEDSSLDYLNYIFETLGMGPFNQRDNIARNTSKEYLLNQFNANGYKNVVRDLEEGAQLDVVHLSVARDPRHLSLRVDVNLAPENLVDILTLTKSVDKVLVGKVFLGRLLVNAFKMTAIAFVAEDPAGELAVRIVVYDFPHHFSVFRKGIFVAIANPYFKRTMDGGYALRSDKSSEVIILNEDLLKARFPNVEWKSLSNAKTTVKPSQSSSKKSEVDKLQEKVENFRKMGNKYYAERNYIAAIASYTEGLSLSPLNQDILSNRALCYLKVENYKNALKDASVVLEKNPLHVKAIYRAAKANIGLKQYDQAKEILEEKLKLNIPKDDLKPLLKSTKEYITQRDNGIYDMAKLYVSERKAVIHDVADYEGPIKVVDVGSKGRGLIVTQDVQPGQLLLSAKAFGIYFSEEDEKDLPGIANGFKSERALLNIIEQKIAKDPQNGKDVYALTAGKKLGYLNPEIDNCSKVDTKRVEAIININGLEIGLEQGHCRGLWILPSYINNDCFNSNASVTLFGDVTQVRSIKSMKAGDEILIPYREHACALWKRVFGFQVKDFVCKCDFCLYESRELKNICLHRDGLLGAYQNGDIDPKKLTELIKKLRDLSKDSPYADHYVALPQYSLANVYYEKNCVNKAIAAYKEFIRDWQRYGGDITALLYRASSQLFYLYLGKGDIENAKRYRDVLKEHVKLNYGSCEGTLLEAMYPGITMYFSLVDA